MKNVLVMCVFLLSAVAWAQDAVSSGNETKPPDKSKGAVPVTMTECEGTNDCATWTFLGSQGNGQWPSGEISSLSVERYDNDSVVIRRADSTGPSAGLTAVYSGTRHGDRVGGEFTSSWPGHWDNKSGNWYATVEKNAQSLPSVMHFCALNCNTLKWKDGHYVPTIKYSWEPPGFSTIWTVESFTPESVILHRHDTPNPLNPDGLNGWDADYKGQISKEGNRLVNITVNGNPDAKVRLTWGTALSSTPGSNAERDGAQQPQQAQRLVVCYPWFFSVVCQ